MFKDMKLVILLVVVLTLFVLSIHLTFSQGEEAIGGYAEQVSTTLYDNNPIDFEKFYCDRMKEIEVHESLDWVLTCFKTKRQLEDKYELELFDEEL